MRIESGPIKFGHDWPGIFIRGDDAFFLTNTIKVILEYINGLENIPNTIQLNSVLLESYMKLIESSNIGSKEYLESDVQVLKDYSQCIIGK